MTKKRKIIIGVIAGLAIIGYLQPDKRKSSKSRVNEADIPKYTIIKEDDIPGIKHSFDIRLEKKTTPEVLERISEDLHDDYESYERTFIVYYLPNMQVGAGGWATGHFNPSLDVRIIGATIEQEAKILAPDTIYEGKEIIGRWYIEKPYTSMGTTIYKDGGKTFLQHKIAEGYMDAKEMVVTNRNGIDYYHEKDGGNGYGEYFTTENGKLKWYDESGYFQASLPR